MGFIKRTARFKVYTGEIPEYVDRTFITTPEKLDRRLEDLTEKIAKLYQVDPEDVEMYKIIVEVMQHITPLNWRRR